MTDARPSPRYVLHKYDDFNRSERSGQKAKR